MKYCVYIVNMQDRPQLYMTVHAGVVWADTLAGNDAARRSIEEMVTSMERMGYEVSHVWEH